MRPLAYVQSNGHMIIIMDDPGEVDECVKEIKEGKLRPLNVCGDNLCWYKRLEHPGAVVRGVREIGDTALYVIIHGTTYILTDGINWYSRSISGLNADDVEYYNKIIADYADALAGQGIG